MKITLFPENRRINRPLLVIQLQWLKQPFRLFGCLGLREAFAAVIRDGNIDGQFKNPDTGAIMMISLLQLLQDVPTRWDSVYYMICHFWYLHPVSGCVNLMFCMIHFPDRPSIIFWLLWFNLMRVEIHELRPEVVTEDDDVWVHYQSRTNVWQWLSSKTLP